MGIPAYYRTLCNLVPNILLKKPPKEITIGSLWIDFNCVVYHCIHKPGTDAYPGEEERVVWEDKLIKIVVQYIKTLVKESNVEEGGKIFLGVDGVVPMAKMRQQRKRRFKSAWLAEHEMKLGKPFAPRWDSNSITPGTAFMERLAESLKKEARWEVSCAGEPGEGEQKLFERIRQMKTEKAVAVYGLDADLILMSLYQQMNQENNIFLFREHTEFGGGVKYNIFDNTEEFRFLNIKLLGDTISKGETNKRSYIIDYCAAMMLLGNDFIPHGIWFTIRDGGYNLLEELVVRVRLSHGRLVDDDLVWRRESLVAIIEELAKQEEGRLGAWIYKKFQQNVRRGKDLVEEWEVALDEWNQTPIKERDEARLLKFSNDSCVKLSNHWRENYYNAYLGARSAEDIRLRVKTYCEGLQWALSYLTGKREVSQSWMYPWSYPPLWADILGYLKDDANSFVCPVVVNCGLKPQEQLALVLPLSSWWLVRDPSLKKLPYLLPHMWKFDLSFCTAGKRMMWECDPHVPLFTPERLRFLQNKASENNIRWDKLSHKDLTLHMSEFITTS